MNNPAPSQVLRRRREALGLQQNELARAIGAYPQHLSDWERGGSRALPLKYAIRLAARLDCDDADMQALLGGHVLSPDQARLLTLFEQLSDDNRGMLLAMAETMRDKTRTSRPTAA